MLLSVATRFVKHGKGHEKRQWKLSDGVLNDPKAILLADLVCSPAIAKKSGVNAAFTFGAA